MCATQYQSAQVNISKITKILFGNCSGYIARCPPFFSEWNKQWAGSLNHADARVRFGNRLRIRATLNGRFRCHHAYFVAPCNLRRGPCTWSYDAHNGDTNSSPDGREREGRRRVAGYDEQLDPVRFEKLGIFDRVTLNRRERLGTVRNACGIAQVNKMLGWKSFVQRAVDCQATDAAVKNANGKV